MRFRKHMQLAQVRPGSAVLDIGSRNGDLRKYLPRDVKYQGLDIAPEFAAPDILIHDITSGLPFPDASFDYVFMVEVLEHTPTAYSTAGEIHRVLRPGGVWMVSVPNPYHVKEIIWNLFHVSDRQGDERIPPRGLGRHILLSTDSRALVDARAVGRLQVREDLIARRWLWAVQGLVTLAVVAFVGRSIARNWSEFRSLHVTLAIAPGWIAGSVVLVFVTYAMQIESWRRILAGWGQRLAFGPAARTWSVANLGRYVPGKVWSVAGLVVLAQRAGVEPGPAAASAFVIQAVSLGSGVAVVAAVTPHSAPPLRLALAGLAAVATILVLVWRPTALWLGRVVNAVAPLEPLAPSAVFAGAILTVLSWGTYGAALWMLAQGLIPDAPLPLTTAIGAFTLGYILGLLALFAPGGVGVRELVLVGLLAPFLGSGGAVALSVASRVLLTLTEALAALLTLPLRHRPQESVQ
jgi:SAM-dependent methyltransferase